MSTKKKTGIKEESNKQAKQEIKKGGEWRERRKREEKKANWLKGV